VDTASTVHRTACTLTLWFADCTFTFHVNRLRTEGAPTLTLMGVNYGGQGDESPEFGVGTIMQIVSQILSCFKISSIRLLALQCGKMFANPMTLTEYSLHPNTSSTSTKYFRRKFNIFLARTRTKIPLTMHQNTPFEMKNF